MTDFSENTPSGNVIDPMSAAMLAAKNGKDRPTADQYAANGQLVPESLRMLHDVITAATAYESEADQIDPGAVKDILDAGRITPERTSLMLGASRPRKWTTMTATRCPSCMPAVKNRP